MMNFNKMRQEPPSPVAGLAASNRHRVANAAPSPVGSGIQWAQSPGWGHGGPAGTATVAAGTRRPGRRIRAVTAVTAAAGPPPPGYGYGGYGGGYDNGGGGLHHWSARIAALLP